MKIKLGTVFAVVGLLGLGACWGSKTETAVESAPPAATEAAPQEAPAAEAMPTEEAAQPEATTENKGH